MYKLYIKIAIILSFIILNLNANNIEEAQRRLPPVIYSLEIPKTIESDKTYKFKWSIMGYHSDYETMLVIYANNKIIFKQSVNSYKKERGSYKYNQVYSNKFFYQTNVKLDLKTNSKLVVRIFYKSSTDVDEGIDDFVSCLIPGGLNYEYADTSGRKILIDGVSSKNIRYIKFVSAVPESGKSYALTNENITFKVGTYENYYNKIKVYIAFHTGTEYLPEVLMQRVSKTLWTKIRALKLASPNKKYKIIIKSNDGEELYTIEKSIEVRESVSQIAQEAYNYAISQLGKKSGYINGKYYVWVDSQYTYCARFARAVYNKPGKYSTAISMYEHYNNLNLIKKDMYPKKGDIVFYGEHSTNGYAGHVGIADGLGNIISVYSTRDGINSKKITSFSAKYLGYVKAEDFVDYY